ncbi:hypothetical protein FVEN_g96 [Fusarium venenatum]|uniref:Uncharacterized protein n=1 Tax=Fusarium venenatum TaxID=56646 RepID=A0A2L2TG26_9HYPO|nr:uncharacterized protein FVRRES_07813 [Fusarium venenatum]KAG8362260.1 hypothetical protein FVEN_g96 [Fusarium venenatum]CEI63377.1 unnamed protein product [Fusarium venenatum]
MGMLNHGYVSMNEQPFDKPTAASHGHQGSHASVDSINDRLSEPWEPGFWKRFPLKGFSSWLLSLISTIVAVVVLVLSDQTPVDHWDSRMQPTVWLALTSTISGAFLAHALAEGAALSFWRQACKSTTLPNLEAIYASSTSLLEAICNLARLRSKRLGFASIVVTLSMLRNPLIQRATSTTTQYSTIRESMNFPIARELPYGYGATLSGRNTNIFFLTSNFSKIAQSYSSRDEIRVYNSSCDNCTATVQGFGFAVNCTEKSRRFDMSTEISSPMMSRGGDYLFQINVTEYRGLEIYSSKNGSRLRFTTLWKATHDCSGDLKIQTCDLTAGITKYPIAITEGANVKLQGTWHDDIFIEPRRMIPMGVGKSNILGGFVTILSSVFTSYAFMKRTTTWGTELMTSGLPATQYMSLNGSEPSCMDTWTNPMENIIEAAREISFRASMQYAAENITNSQTTEFKRNTMQSVYETDYSKMAIALVVAMAGTLATLPLFWGFWDLGRHVSLNPFEVVIAFLGMPETHPIMGKIDPNMNVGNILKSTESIGPVRYGVWHVNGRPRLGFAQAEVVRSPKDSERFIY